MSEHLSNVRKITIALSGDLVEYADQQARRRRTSRSQVIGQALAQARAREQERLAAEGYRFYAGEAADFAAAALPAIRDAWEEPTPGEEGRADGG
jgi:predicted transcriptional regulator